MKMKRFLSLMLVFALASCMFVACSDDDDNPAGPQIEDDANILFVLNSGATSISVVNLDDGVVTNDVVTVGTWPNQLVSRGDNLYCVNSGSNNVEIFDTKTWSKKAVDLGIAQNPMTMAFYNDDIAFVACSVSMKVHKINVTTREVLATADAGTGATGVFVKNGKVYVTNTGYVSPTDPYEPGVVYVYDAESLEKTGEIAVGINPQTIAETPDGKLHVVCSGDYGATASGVVSVIDPATDAVVKTIEVGGAPGSIAVSENGMGYLGYWTAGANCYDTTAEAPEVTSFYGEGVSGLTVGNGNHVFFSSWDGGNVVELNEAGEVVATYEVSVNPSALCVK